MLFSVRLDESGTDGRSPYTVIGGAVAQTHQWSKLESAWDALLKRSSLSAFHSKEFNARTGEFAGWGDLKHSRFKGAMEKIISRNVTFRVSIGVESRAHADIKKRMKGIKGFIGDSDYSLCLRYLMFHSCEQLASIDPDCTLSILVEDGPWASGAMNLYQRVSAMQGKWKPAKHAHRLAGFASLPKGVRPSLEAADYIADVSLARMIAGRRPNHREKWLSILLTEELLETWYLGMIAEKEARRAFGGKSHTKGGA